MSTSPSRRRPPRAPDAWRRMCRRYAALERPPTCPADLADRVLRRLGLVEAPQRPDGAGAPGGRGRALLAVAALALAALLPAAPLPQAGWADLSGRPACAPTRPDSPGQPGGSGPAQDAPPREGRAEENPPRGVPRDEGYLGPQSAPREARR